MSKKSTIVCYGEILWDMLPKGIFLGGAPLNVACHFAKWGEGVSLYSAVGKDILGLEAVNRIEKIGIDTRYVFKHANIGTGTVRVDLSPLGEPNYTFESPVAYDHIRVSNAMVEACLSADAFVYGTLAQRQKMNRKGLMRLLETTKAMRFYDVNLRPPCMDRSLVMELAQNADCLKLNLEELTWILDTDLNLISLEAAVKAISELTETQRVCITLGEKGVYYWDSDKSYQVEAPSVEVKDTIGAGDAFHARMIEGILNNEDILDMLKASCDYGAMVASIEGALPEACELKIS